jgi:hypothetical protein
MLMCISLTVLNDVLLLSYILECIAAGSPQPLRPRHFVGASEGM